MLHIVQDLSLWPPYPGGRVALFIVVSPESQSQNLIVLASKIKTILKLLWNITQGYLTITGRDLGTGAPRFSSD